MKLEKLKVKSFITKLSNQHNIKGGIIGAKSDVDDTNTSSISINPKHCLISVNDCQLNTN